MRGTVDLIINSTYWLGVMLGALGTYIVLNPHILPPRVRLEISHSSLGLPGSFHSDFPRLGTGESTLVSHASSYGGG